MSALGKSFSHHVLGTALRTEKHSSMLMLFWSLFKNCMWSFVQISTQLHCILLPGKNSFLDTVLMLLKMCLWAKGICIYVTLGEKGRRGQGKGW